MSNEYLLNFNTPLSSSKAILVFPEIFVTCLNNDYFVKLVGYSFIGCQMRHTLTTKLQ